MQEETYKGTYSKPTGGIPKTDLANDVQTSLGKADTALQEHQDISGKAEKTEVNALFNSISDAWDSATAYTVGQYCIYNNAIWKCLVANTNTEPAEGTYWTQTTIDAEIASVNSSLESVSSSLGNVSVAMSPKQITDDNAFNNKFEAFYDWSGWLQSKSNGIPKYCTVIRMPSADTNYVTFIAISCETATFGTIYVGTFNCRKKTVSLHKTIG